MKMQEVFLSETPPDGETAAGEPSTPSLQRRRNSEQNDRQTPPTRDRGPTRVLPPGTKPGKERPPGNLRGADMTGSEVDQGRTGSGHEPVQVLMSLSRDDGSAGSAGSPADPSSFGHVTVV